VNDELLRIMASGFIGMTTTLLTMGVAARLNRRKAIADTSLVEAQEFTTFESAYKSLMPQYLELERNHSSLVAAVRELPYAEARKVFARAREMKSLRLIDDTGTDDK
jgi:hypothetical protein